MTDKTCLSLASGDSMPYVGLGTWKIAQDEVAGVVDQAIELGYRHFDCACDYGNERQVGQGLAEAFRSGKCRREDVWVTSKLWNTYHAAEHVRPAVERTLADLQLEQLDLYLIHFPIALRFVPFEKRYPPEWVYEPSADEAKMELVSVPLEETWHAMESLVQAGLVKHIGVCNYNVALLRDLLAYAKIRPEVLQVELHPYLTQEKLLRFCQQEQIAVTGFSPLGANSYFSLGMATTEEAVIEREVIGQIAAKHGRTPAQVVLRWGIQRGTAIVPKSSSLEHLRENLDLFSFSLDDQEMQTIAQLNINRRFNDPGDFCETAFGTFCPIYE